MIVLSCPEYTDNLVAPSVGVGRLFAPPPLPPTRSAISSPSSFRSLPPESAAPSALVARLTYLTSAALRMSRRSSLETPRGSGRPWLCRA